MRPTFGIMTAPMQVGYDDVLRVWREADTVPAIEHAWVFDHLMPIGGDPAGPALEGWTLLARREYAAHGLPFHDTADAVGALAEACTVIRRLWSEPEPFDFDGTYVQLTGAFCNPKPVGRPPLVIGGRAAATLRIVAEHADVWNIPGGDHDDVVRRSALLDHYCAEIGRDPAAIVRSIHLGVAYDAPGTTRDAIGRALEAGFRHVVLRPEMPWRDGVAQWLADEVIGAYAERPSAAVQRACGRVRGS